MAARDDWEDADGAEPTFGFQDLLAITRRRLRLIAFIVAAGVGLAVIVSLSLTNQYAAVATVQLDERSKTIVNIDSVVERLKGDTPTIESEVEIIASSDILSRVVRILKLRKDAEFNGAAGVRSLWSRLGVAPVPAHSQPRSASAGPTTSPARGVSYLDEVDPPGTTAPHQDDVVTALARNIKVQRVRNSRLINISVRSRDPEKSAKIANTIAEVYVETQRAGKQAANMRATELLQKRITTLRQTLSQTELRLERFKSANDIFDAEGHLLAEKQLAREMESIVLARNDVAKARARYDQSRRLMLEGGAEDSIGEVLDNPTIRLLREGLSRVLRKQAELQTRYGPRHPARQSIAADVAKAQNTLAIEVNKIIKNLRSQYVVSRQRLEQLEANMTRLKTSIAAHRETQAGYRNREREVKANRKLYEALLLRAKQVNETASLQLSDARLVQRAGIPDAPVAPKRTQIVLMAFAVSLALAFGLAFALEFSLPGFGRPEEIERALDLPQIAALPDVPPLATSDMRQRDLHALRLMLTDTTSTFAENIRALRHELDARRPHPASRIILIASALPNEGKSMVASNLAHYMCLTGYRTLLVDSDLRRGKLSRSLGLSNRPGLLDVLDRRCAIGDAILTDRTTGLSVLPARENRDDGVSAPELLSSRRLPTLLQELKQHYDTIIVDAPPVMPVMDARLLATYADQIAFVMAWRKTPKAVTRRALKLLGRNKAKIAGIVVNRIDPNELDDTAGYRAPPDRSPAGKYQHRAA